MSESDMVRFIEFFISLFSLIILFPLFVIIGLLIKINSKGPVLYKSERAGKQGRVFTMYKFRTMVDKAKNNGPPVTSRNDPRVTWTGRMLRKTKLDELPQLFNVLKGDMGFVGARPEDPDIVKNYNHMFREILQYRPGITSPASIQYKSEESLIPEDNWETVYIQNILPRKIQMDTEYMQQAGFFKDIGVILRTVGIGKK